MVVRYEPAVIVARSPQIETYGRWLTVVVLSYIVIPYM